MEPNMAGPESIFRSIGLSESTLRRAMNDSRTQHMLAAATLPEEDVVAQIQRAKDQFESERRLGPGPRVPVLREHLAMSMAHWRRELQKSLTTDESIFRRTYIGFPKHSSRTPLSELAPIRLADMQVRKTHVGSYLLCRTFTLPTRLVAICAGIEDTDGVVQMLSIYNFPGALSATLETLDEILPLGTTIALREPTMKMDTSGRSAFIRVDSPTDVVFLDAKDPIILDARWRTPAAPSGLPSTADACRLRGNAHFKAERYLAASIAYTRGLRFEPPSKSLLLNRALAYLHLEYYSAALSDAELVIRDETTEGQDRVKALFRAARAYYGRAEYSCAQQLFKEVLVYEPGQVESVGWVRRCEQRMKESRDGDGAYDWAGMYKEAQDSIHLDVADWVGPVEVASMPSRGGGRGVIATRDVRVGELLMVAKPYAVGFPATTRETYLSYNLSTTEIHGRSRVELISRTIAKVMAEPSSAPLVCSLYAGPDSLPAPPTYPEPAASKLAAAAGSAQGNTATTLTNLTLVQDVDVLHIERACSFNAFGIQNISSAPKARTFDSTPSALYALPSLVNHACAGTATWACWGDVIVVRATCNLQRGEEVTMAYVNSSTYVDRAKFLSKYFGSCDCWLCAQERRDGEERCIERERLTDAFRRYTPANRTVSAARDFVKAMEATYIPGLSTAGQVRPMMQIAYGALGMALRMRAFETGQRSMYGEVATTYMQALEAVGITVIDKSLRGRLAPSDSRTTIPIAMTRAPVLEWHEATLQALGICASFYAMLDDLRAARWFKAAQWLNDAIFGGGEALFRVQYAHVFEDMNISACFNM
ncbi:hypothetical protein EXIGLDRAFT_642702 [Exidia glandulosa HHB12029]|uniref:SET domain-containing protein n=1 Tax=Exidia glandulosa HHB12029 TaxID=1314781 RepID=A0A165KW80_EXIGL|nr:hypothetical protein EXIGLDRAFT_642702 [Exidia glandulosa HHB12029]